MLKALEGLNQEQKEAVETTQGPLLIIAGAGTGKTTVITRRIAYLIERKLAKPSEILALTFTEKAAGEMEERVDLLVPYGYVDTWISTFHAFGNRVLQENALEIGLPPDFKVLTKPAQVLFFQQNLFRFDLDIYRPLANPTKFIEAILSFISRCKDEDISPSDYRKYVDKLKAKSSKIKQDKEEFEIEIKKQEELAAVYEQYEKYKKEAGLLDFGDQVFLTLKLFRFRPAILRKYQEQFKYILVDEFQDTNWAQNELVKLLAAKRKNICVVADDDQSIYRFRGAAISNVLEFKKNFPKAKIVNLVKNYRSTASILEAAYRLIVHNNPDRLEVQQKINKKLVPAISEKGNPVTVISAQTASQEADLVASEISKLAKIYSYKDIAILVRANSQAENFLRSLNLKGIPHKFVGSTGLYSQPEIRLLISFLYSLVEDENSLQLFTLATSEIYNLPMEDAVRLSALARKRARSLRWVFENLVKEKKNLEISEKAVEIVSRILTDLKTFLEEARKENVGKVLYDFLQKSGLLAKLSSAGNAESEAKIQNIARFFDKIREFGNTNQNQSISSFVEWLEIMRSVGEDPATADFDPDLNAVNVITVHAAKGLEFKVVFLVCLVSESFPSRSRGEALALPDELIKETLPSGDFHLQEERRLFYVGMTRAREKLYFSWARDMGGKRIRKVSPFVLEALEKTTEEIKAKSLNPMDTIEQFALFDSTNASTGKLEPKIIRLSQSSIDDYETCAYKYRYIHVLRLPIAKHHAVVYGSALHKAVAGYYQARMNGKNLSLAELLSIFEDAWVSEGFLSLVHEEQRFAQGKKVLIDFFKREEKNDSLPTFLEKDFRFMLGDNLVLGRFDRVDISGKDVKIIDFKSTESRSEEEVEKAAKESLQLKVYALAYYKMTGRIPAFVGIYDLESGFLAGYEPSSQQLKETEKLILETGQKIRENLKAGYFPANPKYFGRLPACNYCAYSAICPFSLTK